MVTVAAWSVMRPTRRGSPLRRQGSHGWDGAALDVNAVIAHMSPWAPLVARENTRKRQTKCQAPSLPRHAAMYDRSGEGKGRQRSPSLGLDRMGDPGELSPH